MQSKTGIIIDDDYDEVDIISLFLEIKGYDIVGKGHNGDDAVTLYNEHKPDFVILGGNMSQYGDTSAIVEIKKMNSDANIFVLTDSKFKNFGKDVNAVLSKPCDLYEILEAIEMKCYLDFPFLSNT